MSSVAVAPKLSVPGYCIPAHVPRRTCFDGRRGGGDVEIQWIPPAQTGAVFLTHGGRVTDSDRERNAAATAIWACGHSGWPDLSYGSSQSAEFSGTSGRFKGALCGRADTTHTTSARQNHSNPITLTLIFSRGLRAKSRDLMTPSLPSTDTFFGFLGQNPIGEDSKQAGRGTCACPMHAIPKEFYLQFLLLVAPSIRGLFKHLLGHN